MKIYQSFATIYAKGPYTKFSLRMAELLPDIQSKFDLKPTAVLDLACGEGTFAIEMAKSGYQATGIDISLPMLQIAKAKADAEQVDVSFINQDIRAMSFENRFDLVTCWYDSLNYLLTTDDLLEAFHGAARALKKDGLFVFDMNTIYGLSVIWRGHPLVIEQDTPDLMEIHRITYDDDTSNAELRITCFVKEGEHWNRFDESHTVHGFSLNEIRQCAKEAGLKELACWGNLSEMTEPAPDSGKVLFVFEK